jgi:hypothetical protein
MIFKVAIDVFGESVSEELETYLKIRKAGTIDGLRIPELKGRFMYFHIVNFRADNISGIFR